MPRVRLVGFALVGIAAILGLTSISANSTTEPDASPVLTRQAEISHQRKMAEWDMRWSIYDQVHVMLAKRDYAGLNAMEREFRTSRATTPSGIWKLEEFHDAVEAYLPTADSKDGCPYLAGEYLEEWLRTDPTSPAPYIAQATKLLDQAWCFRGDGFASQVAEDAWRPFHENIDAAYAVLMEHKRVASVDPGYYAVMIDIYRAQNRKSELSALLDEATDREPYYYPIYANAYFSYMPQWGGSTAEIDELARYAVARTQKRDGLGAYARYYWYASSDNCDCWTDAINWETMKLAMRDVATRYPDAWNLANFARFGCMFNDRETARSYFDKLGAVDVSIAWPDVESYRRCRAFAGA